LAAIEQTAVAPPVSGKLTVCASVTLTVSPPADTAEGSWT
jgi:hypothetical protein